MPFNKVETSENTTVNGSEDELKDIYEDLAKVRLNASFDPIAVLLSEHGDNAENITLELRKHGIKFENLASLDDKDLELLGITDSKVRKEVLEQIEHIPNQAEHYEQVSKDMDLHAYNRTVLNNVAEHLDNITAILSATDLKLQIDSQPENILLDDNKTYTSSEILDVLMKMENQCMEIETMLRGMQMEGRIKFKTETESGGLFQNIKKTFICTSIITSISYLVLKYFKANK